METEGEDMMTFGQRLRAARELRLLTQPELSWRSGVAAVTISRLENDKSPYPRPGTVRRLAEALDVDPAMLMWGSALRSKKTRTHTKAPPRG